MRSPSSKCSYLKAGEKRFSTSSFFSLGYSDFLFLDCSIIFSVEGENDYLPEYCELRGETSEPRFEVL